MDKATAQNSRMRMWHERELRKLILDFDNGGSVSAMVFTKTWNSIVPIALRDAPADLRTSMINGGKRAMTRLPVCPETLSVLRLLRLMGGLDLPIAARVAEGWMQLPVQVRAEGKLTYQCPRVVSVQLLGLVERPCPAFTAKMPDALSGYLKAAHYAGLAVDLSPCWRAAETFLGSTCISFVGPRGYGLEACLAISDCAVSYTAIEDGGLPEAREAVQALIDYLPRVGDTDAALRLAEWNPAGHDFLEVAAFLDDLKSALAQPAPE